MSSDQPQPEPASTLPFGNAATGAVPQLHPDDSLGLLIQRMRDIAVGQFSAPASLSHPLVENYRFDADDCFTGVRLSVGDDSVTWHEGDETLTVYRGERLVERVPLATPQRRAA